jgi:hypothetical protein
MTTMTIELPRGFETMSPTDRFHFLACTLRRKGWEIKGQTFNGWPAPLGTEVTTGQCGNNWIPIIVPSTPTRKTH